jgi:hypothetical protein
LAVEETSQKKIRKRRKIGAGRRRKKNKGGEEVFLVAEWGNLACLLLSQRGLATALAPDYYLLVSWVF